MARPTKAELVQQLLELNVTFDEIGGIIVDDALSESEKLEALEELLFDTEEDEGEEVDM